MTGKHSRAKADVLLIFHGTGDEAQSMANQSQLDRLAENGEFVLIYLTASKDGQWTLPNTLGEFPDDEDLNVVDAVLDHLTDLVPNSSGRVHLVGLSSGGTFALCVAARCSEGIKSVVVHSGRRPLDEFIPAEDFPILFLIGTQDESTPPETVQSAADWYQRQGHIVETISIPGGEHRWYPAYNSRIAEWLKAN
ncbi:MAG: dienelactone hydrolase family protein [Planctomycetaceae bacterium]